MRLFTSRYQNGEVILRLGLNPVGITLGEPKMALPYDLTANVKILAPTRAMFHLQDPAFRDAYMAHLDGHGSKKINDLLMRFDDGRPMVLLCFESVVNGEACHRRKFADWWFRQTGEEIPEIEDESPWFPKGKAKGNKPAPKGSLQLPLTLF